MAGGAGRRRLLTLVGAAASIGLVLYLGIVGWFWANQRALLFAADTARVTPGKAGLPGFAEVLIETPDGERLVAWWRPPPAGRGAVLYFHGNSGALADRAQRFRDMAAAGLGVLAPAYRGYGGSTGRPSETALIGDAKTTLDWLVARTPEETTAVMGESLGTGVAVALVAERRVGGVLLDSPYASIDRIGARLYPWLPVRLLASDRFDSEARIAQVEEPLLIVHCEGDRLIPIAEARRLLARARRGGELLSVAGCGHVETWRDADARARMLATLRRITDGVATSAGDRDVKRRTRDAEA